jgi:hypothetical protein
MSDRIDPPSNADEKPTLLAFLDYHRATLRDKCAGLTPDELVRPASPPSSLRLLGLVRHLTEVEEWWFSQVFAGDEPFDLYSSADDPDADLHVGHADEAVVTQTWQRFDEQVGHSRAIAAGGDLDAPAARSLSGNAPGLRWILVHMIEEYARHNGHADLLREAIDGAVGE